MTGDYLRQVVERRRKDGFTRFALGWAGQMLLMKGDGGFIAGGDDAELQGV
ncbi:MAG TPA: hypothetical protein P5526_31830 [Anaerolineae bacterium]|nr:hypothetical protein [Anaerolineae bacterium]